MYNILSSKLRVDQIIELGQLTEQLNKVAYLTWRDTSSTSAYTIQTSNNTTLFEAERDQLHEALQYTVLLPQEPENQYLIIGWRGTIHLEHIKVDLEKAPASETFASYKNNFLQRLNTLVGTKPFSNNKITIVFNGHSLGGSIAQLCIAELASTIHSQHEKPSCLPYPNLTPNTIQRIVLATANSPGIEDSTIKSFVRSSDYLNKKRLVELHALILRTRGDLVQHHCDQLASGGTWTSRRIIERPGLLHCVKKAPQEIWRTLCEDGFQAGLSHTAKAYLDIERTHLFRYLSNLKMIEDTPIHIIAQEEPLTEETFPSGIIIFSDATPSGNKQLLDYLGKDKNTLNIENIRFFIKSMIPSQSPQVEDPCSLDNWLQSIVENSTHQTLKKIQQAKAEESMVQYKELWDAQIKNEKKLLSPKQRVLEDFLTHIRSCKQRIENTIWRQLLKIKMLQDMYHQKHLASLLGWHCTKSTHFDSPEWHTEQLWEKHHLIRQKSLSTMSLFVSEAFSNKLPKPVSLRDKESLWNKALASIQKLMRLHPIYGLGIDTKTLQSSQLQARNTITTCMAVIKKIEDKEHETESKVEKLCDQKSYFLSSGKKSEWRAKW